MTTGTSAVTFYYRDTVPGSPTLTASANGQSWTTATQQQTVDPGPPAVLELTSGTATMTAGSYLTVTIDVVDAYGNPTDLQENRDFLLTASSAVQGAGIAAPATDQLGQFYLTGDHSTPITTLPMTTGQQTAQVDYRSTDANGGDPHHIIILSETPSMLSGLIDVTVQPGSISASASLVEAAVSPVVADGSPSTVTVTVTDQWGNPKSGVTVTLACTGDGNHTNPGGGTDGNGAATGSVADTTAESVTVSATAGGFLLDDKPQIVFVPGLVSASRSDVVADSPVVADDATQGQITVTAMDANGNLVSGSSVILSVTPPGNGVSVTQPLSVTDPTGKAFGWIRSSKIGTRTVHAVIGATSVVDTAPVLFEPGVVDRFEWSFTETAKAGDYKDVTLKVYDALDNLVTDYADTVFISTTKTGGSEDWAKNGATGDLGTYPDGRRYYKFKPTDLGVAPLRVRVTVKETITLSAERQSVQNTSAPLVVDNGLASQIEIVPPGNGQTAQVAQPVPLDLVVRVKDTYNNLVDNEPVTFDNVTGGGSVDVDGGGPLTNVATTGSNGEARCDVWTLGQTVGPNTVRARIVTSANVVFSASGTHGPGTQIVLTPLSGNVTVGTAIEVGATLGDQFGNAVPGVLLTIIISDTPNGTLESNPADPNPTTGGTTSRQGTSDSNGKITVRYRAPGTAGLSDTIDATGGNVGYGAVADRVFTSVAGGATKLLISGLTPTTQHAGSTFSFTIQAVDGNDNLVPTNTSTVNITRETGSGLEFSETDWNLPLVTQVTLVGGKKDVYGRGYTTGTWTFTVDDAGPLLPDSDDIEITSALTIDHYDVTESTGSVTAGASFNVTVVARDQWGNRVTTAINTVNLDPVDLTNNVVTPALSVPSATLASGQVVVVESYTKARSIKVRAQAAGKLGYSGVIQVNPATAHHIVPVSPNLTGIVAGTTVQDTAEVQDNYDNPVPIEPVTFSAPVGGGSVSPPSAQTGSNGLVTFDHTTGTTAGSNVARAQILDGNPINLETVEWSVQTIAGTVIDHYDVTTSTGSVTAGANFNVTIVARDQNGNKVTTANNNVNLDPVDPVTLNVLTDPLVVPSTTLVSGEKVVVESDTTARSIKIRARDASSKQGYSGVVTVSHAPAYKVIKISGDAPPPNLTAGAVRPLEVEVQDAYANTVDGEPVTFSILSPPTGATLDPGGVVNTDSEGRAPVNLNTSTTAGPHSVLARILNGSPANLETKTFTVTTVAGAITHYEVVPAATEQLAGEALNFTVRALDASNNIVDDDVTVVALSLAKGSGAVFGQNPVTLSNGTFPTTVTSNAAQVIQIKAQTQGNPAIFGLSPDITIRPNVASGTITATAVPDTITANGISTSLVTSGVIRDAFNNVVAQGTLVTVATSPGTITSPDADPGTPSTIERATDSGGQISFAVRSGTVAGTANVSMQAVAPGTAMGSRPIVFAQPPVMANPGAPTPGVVTPGETVFFTVFIQNTSPTAVWLSTGSTLSFTDGVDVYTASLAATTFVAGPGSKNLVFQSALVPDAMDPMRYTPTLSLTGIDEYGATFPPTNLSLPVNSLSVTAIEIVDNGIVPASSVVSRGQIQNITVSVKNKGPIAATIQSVNFTFSVGNQYFSYQSVLSPSVNIPGNNTTVPIIVPVTVLQTAPVGTTTIDAAVAGTVSGTPVSDPSLSPYLPLPTWDIRSGADIAYVAGSLTPSTVSRGKTYSFKVRLRNDGDATVELRTPGTKFSFLDGSPPYQPALTQNETLGAGVTKEIAFIATQIPTAITPDRTYDVQLHIEGQENFVDFPPIDLFTGAAGDSVAVLLPANVVYVAGSLDPQLVTRTVSSSFEIRVNNLGTAEVELTPVSTTISFAGGTYTAQLDPSFGTTISSGTTTLRFISQVVNSAAGAYTPQIHLFGTENTQPFSPPNFPTTPEQVTVQNPANISIASIAPSQSTITANQQKSITVAMTVTSTQPVAVNFKNASLRFMLNGSQDLTSRFTITPPTGFVTHGATLPGNTTDALRFTISDNTGNDMTTGNYVIEGNLCVTDAVGGQDICVDTNGGGKGNLLVQSPGVLNITGIVPSKTSVTTGQTQLWTAEMTVKNTGEAKVQLDLGPSATLISFSLDPTGWVSSLQTTGPDTLGLNESATLAFNVTQSGNTPGTATINGTVRGIELNSDVVKIDQTPPGAGTVSVQTPASLQITQPIVKSRDPVTEGQTTPWTIAVTVANTGGAEALLSNLAADTYVDLPGAAANGRVTGPTGTLALPGGQQTVLTFTVSPTPGFGGVAGQKTFNVHIQGRELNTSLTKETTSSGNVFVQLKPDPQYVANSLTPKAVKRGSDISFSVQVTEVTGAATVQLTAADTQIRFTDGDTLFQRFLDVDKTTAIVPGSTTTIWFEPGIVPAAFVDGVYPITVRLRGTENGNPFSKDFVGPENVAVRPPTTVEIDTMIASRDKVSTSQGRDWTVRMVVANTGSGDVRLNPAGTRLSLRIAGVPVTGEYVIKPLNPIFEGSGDDTLNAGATDALVFTIDATGTTDGNLSVYGDFAGTDVKAGTPVGDDAFDHGWARVLVQRAGVLVVTGVQSSRSDVTAGQTTDWNDSIQIRNTGEAAVSLTFDATTPDIRFVLDSGFEWTRPSGLQGGGTLLSGGATGTLVFPVTRTGNQPGTPAIHAVVAGVDTNSTVTTTFDTEIEGSGAGAIHVEDLGNAVITSATLLVLKAPNVNRLQTFKVRVAAANQGEADLEDVWFKIMSSGGSAPPPPEADTLMAASIPGGGAFVDTFTVKADDVFGPETLTVSILRGKDKNSQQIGLLTIGPDRQVIIQKRNPSALTIESVTPNQSTVTRLQTADWYVDVALWNSGGSPLDVRAPLPTDISFRLGVNPLIDYVVQAPDTFLTGGPNDFHMNPGEKDTLRYTVASTGADLGQVTIRAREEWIDDNDGITRSTQKDGVVTVVSPSGFFINTTKTDPATTPHYFHYDSIVDSNHVYINSGQAFTIRVNVQNQGDVEDLVDVQVRLTSDYASSPLNLTSAPADIPKNQEHTFVFNVNLAPLVAQTFRDDILTSAIVSAKSKNTGLDVTPKPAVDNQQIVTVQRPANLSVTAQASDNSLSTGQVFRVTGRVSNLGIGEVDGSGEFTLRLPTGFVLEPSTPDTTLSFGVSGLPDAFDWDVKAPGAAIANQAIRVKITKRPKDLNIALPSAVRDSVATVVVDVATEGGFQSPAVAISSPAGAMDDTVSTSQTFTVRASAVAEATTIDIQATLVLVDDPGFTVIDPLIQNLPHGSGAEMSVTWRITASASADSAKLQVEFRGTDENTGDLGVVPTDTLRVTIVKKASLVLGAGIARPPDATDGRVAIGSKFEIDATVSNLGDAAIDPAKARVKIDFSKAEGYSLSEGTEERSFTIGEPVTWVVSAPFSPRPLRTIQILMSGVPADENTGTDAFVQEDLAGVGVLTDNVFITADNLSEELGLGGKPVPKGTSDIDMLGIELANTGDAAGPVRVDSIAVSVLTGSGSLAGSPSGTLGEFYAVVNGYRVDGDLGTNPVLFNFSTVPGGVVLNPLGADTDSIVFAVSVLSNAALDEIVLSIENADDVVIRSVSSGKTVPVVDKTTSGSITGRLRSRPLVILGAGFEEYVHNYPNPFRAGSQVTRIAYTMDNAGPVKVTIFDVTGELVYEKQYASGEPGTGEGPQEITWDGRNSQGEVVRNGIYICQLDAGGNSVKIRIAVAK
jgi:hypothetical protein